ncbi:Pimeloyl-ACP methyl ester carboxylesterase [Saccharopolyspora shandongensis]|uniref:Pimeloyl-ACP methyl ester carboxylesterase n=1 Tax=Saccharopolyspora shandongensis TaxID=418495 RepID=A0A1H3R8E8_9PSEU|nr:alpha/beta hydrolase [Saccharopolyspora shandongensis]SDZ21940.1 Pimeloyl-ACP methyl ester carboxylesterase [Saccharopolyspora shandongensis]
MLRDNVESVRLDDVELAYRVVGDGPELVVLLHGWPQTGACWRHVVEPLSRGRTVVAPDLRGYGASGLADSGYDKRSTAADLGGLIRHLGHESAVVIGHDRGARVAHRWALDRPAEVDSLVLLDILPTRVVMRSFDIDSASAMWHWFFHRQPELAEKLITGNVEAYLGHFFARVLDSGAVDRETFEHYVAAFSDPGHLRASFEDYRTGFTTDLELDEADHDRGLRLQAPLLVLWGAEGGLARRDVVRVWQEHHADPAAVSGHAVPGGHYVPEEAPGELVNAVESFLSDARAPRG